jgi:tRNA threonylcarbamoyladenosine biosynthesis protein TsaB
MGEAWLAIELSQRSGSVAVRGAPGSAALELPVPPPDELHDHLANTVAAACGAAGMAPRDLGHVAVSVGPGGFTGLRVACATARAIADVTGCRLVAVPTALVAARAAVLSGDLSPADGARAWVCLAAKADGAWRSEVAFGAGMPREVECGLVGPSVTVPFDLLGDEHVPPGWTLAPGARRIVPRWSARACLEVGEALVRAGLGEPGEAGLLPIYARPPEAVTLWERRHPPASGAASR